MTRMCLVVALPCEARPWVDHYGLSAVPGTPFRTWRGEDVALVASGIGAGAAAAATGYLAGVAGTGPACTWINIGIAGHPGLKRGTVAIVDRCTHRAGGRTWYPPLPVPSTLERQACITVDAVETEYRDDALYDMECSGYFDAASRLATIELVHAVKVVSDGPDQTVDDLGRDTVTALIAEALPLVVETLVEPLLECAGALAADLEAEDVSAWFERWHFSVSNARRLREALRDWRIVRGDVPRPDAFADCRRAGDVLARLRTQIDSHPPRLAGRAP